MNNPTQLTTFTHPGYPEGVIPQSQVMTIERLNDGNIEVTAINGKTYNVHPLTRGYWDDKTDSEINYPERGYPIRWEVIYFDGHKL